MKLYITDKISCKTDIPSCLPQGPFLTFCVLHLVKSLLLPNSMPVCETSMGKIINIKCNQQEHTVAVVRSLV